MKKKSKRELEAEIRKLTRRLKESEKLMNRVAMNLEAMEGPCVAGIDALAASQEAAFGKRKKSPKRAG